MRINFPAELRLRVQNDLEIEFGRTPQGRGMQLQSASRPDGPLMLFADYPPEFVSFIEARGVPVVHLD